MSDLFVVIDAEQLRVVTMQSSGDRPPEAPEIESLRELLARLERCEQMLPPPQQATEQTSSGPSAATTGLAASRLLGWCSNATVATSFAVGFAMTLIAVTLALRPGPVDSAKRDAVQLADNGSTPPARTISAPAAPANTSARSEKGDQGQGSGPGAPASTASTGQPEIKAGRSKTEAKPDDQPLPKLRVAGRLETEVGGTVPFAIALTDAPRAETDAAMLVRGIPDDVALSPAWPMGSGVWFVNPVDAGKLRLTLYAAPRKDSQLSIELWSPDGNLIATAHALLVAPPRSPEPPEAVTEASPPTPAATVLASRPDPTAVEPPAEVRAGAATPPPAVEATRQRASRPPQTSRRRAMRRDASRGQHRSVAQSRRKSGVTLAAQSQLVWPGDAAPRSNARRATARQSSPAVAARPVGIPQVPRSQSPSTWPAMAFGQSRGP